jgi:hypothetical protein
VKSKSGTLNREITQNECKWLVRNYPEGTKVKEFNGCTYGCISSGTACLLNGDTFFTEVPTDAITWEA